MVRRTAARANRAFPNISGLLVLLFMSGYGLALPVPGDGPDKPAATNSVEIIMRDGYPELRVGGEPFFVHAATFDYFRIPRDLWESSLGHYRELGINTIDIAIPWNWHEPSEGLFDFEGRTNPRRDLRGLLRLIAEKRFHLIARPGPVIRAHWRHGGYPEWLLDRAEINMTAGEREAGGIPPAAEEETHDAELAARGWTGNAAHMAALQIWLTAVAHELAPYSSTLKVRVSEYSDKPEDKHEVEISGPLLFVQLAESPGLASLANCTHFWEYLETMRKTLRSGGVEAIFRVNAVSFDSTATSCAPPPEAAFFFTGRWKTETLSQDEKGGAPLPPRRLGLNEARFATLLAQSLGTQTGFPAMVSDFQPGFLTPADDTRPAMIAQANTLLASRLLFARGAQGIEYAPLQDTLTPNGFETQDVNRHDRWDAALSLSGRRQPQAQGVERNGQFLSAWGAFLAASHTRAEYGLVDLRSIAGDGDDTRRVTEALFKIQHVAEQAGATGDLIDLVSRPLATLLRYPVILLPVLELGGQKAALGVEAEQKLVDYVRAGGALIYFPSRPAGETLAPLWESEAAAGTNASGTLLPSWRFGEGWVVEWAKDFFSGTKLNGEAQEGATQEAGEAVESFRRALAQTNARPSLRRDATALLITERISDAGTGKLGLRPTHCARDETPRDAFGLICNRGLLSVTNLNYEQTVEEKIDVLSPLAGTNGPDEDYLTVDLLVPAHESLLLPLHTPLCGDEPKERCEDQVVIAGAELLRAERDAKTLLLTFYAPARATILLRLESQPTKISIGDINLEGKWVPESHQLEFTLPRGAAPDYLRELAVHLKYTPHVPEKQDADKRPKQGFDATVADAVSLPLGEDASLPTYPPLLTITPDRKGSLLYRVENLDANARDVNVKIEGDLHGSGRLGLDPHELLQEKINLSPPGSSPSGSDSAPAPTGPTGLFAAGLQARTGHFERNTLLNFVSMGPEVPVAYAFDFERDGTKEWVLENTRMRLIVSAEDGGRAIAFVDKATGSSLLTLIGGLRDLFAVKSATTGPGVERDLTFNRAYGIEKLEEQKRPALLLRYHVAELGAEIEKTLRIVGMDTVEAEYRVGFGNASGSGVSFVVMNSVPAQGGGDRSTRFCWQTDSSPSQAVGTSPAPEPTCQFFAPDGNAVEIPEGARRLEVRTPGQPTLALAWEAGRLRIEPKMHSALLKLEFTPLAPGAAPSKYVLRYTMIAVESFEE